jgi:hypothetical protein
MNLQGIMLGCSPSPRKGMNLTVFFLTGIATIPALAQYPSWDELSP